MTKGREALRTRREGWTPWARSVATAGTVLLALGAALGVFPFLILAFLLLGALYLARAGQDAGLVIERDIPISQVRAGESFAVSWLAEWTRGDSVVTLHDTLPDAAEVTTGSNFALLVLPPGPGESAVGYEVAVHARGPHILPGTEIARVDPLGMRAAFPAQGTEDAEIVVEPTAPAVPRMRAPAGYGTSLFPEGDMAQRGPKTNDFRELRPYVRGDPLRSVNWKATARASSVGDDLVLVVNEYEVEGKKSIWLFLDASLYTGSGTNKVTVFDRLVEATLSVAHYYLDRGHRVGFTMYGLAKLEVLYPDGGTQQLRRLLAILTYAKPGKRGEERITLEEAAQEVRGFLAREKPLIQVFTLLGRDSANFAVGLASARTMAAAGRRPAPAVVVSPKDPPSPGHADRILAALATADAVGLRARGIFVLEWEAGSMPIQALLAAGVGAR